MSILPHSGASLLEENNLRQTMHYFDTTEKLHVHVGTHMNQKIYFHWPKVFHQVDNIPLGGVLQYKLAIYGYLPLERVWFSSHFV